MFFIIVVLKKVPVYACKVASYHFSRHCKVASTLSQDIVRWHLPLRRIISHLQYSYGIRHSMNQLLGAHHFGMSIDSDPATSSSPVMT